MEEFQEISKPMFGGCWGPSIVHTVHNSSGGWTHWYILGGDAYILHPQKDRKDLWGVCDCLLCDCLLSPASSLHPQPFSFYPPLICHILWPGMAAPSQWVHAGGAQQEGEQVTLVVPLYLHACPLHGGHLCYDSLYTLNLRISHFWHHLHHCCCHPAGHDSCLSDVAGLPYLCLPKHGQGCHGHSPGGEETCS